MGWSKNQIILLIGLIITFLGLCVNTVYLINTANKQTTINLDLNEIKGKVGLFENLNITNVMKIGNNILRSNGSCLFIEGQTSTEILC